MKKLLLMFFLFLSVPAYAGDPHPVEQEEKATSSTLPSISEWDLNGSANADKKEEKEQSPTDNEVITQDLKEFYCGLPEWRRPSGLKCD